MVRLLALLLLALACGAPSEAGQDIIPLGTLEQPIYLPFRYGIEGITNVQGHPDFGRECEGTTPAEWADNNCVVPNSRTVRFKFYASTCNGTWMGAVADAYWDWKAELEYWGWSVIDGSNYQLRCNDGDGGGALGRFVPGPSWDTIGVPQGTLRQHKDGRITMYSSSIDQVIANRSTEEQRIVRMNLIRHELYHLVGFGHTTNGPGNDLMAVAPNSNWYTYRELGDRRRIMLDCYNEGSSTSPRC